MKNKKVYIQCAKVFPHQRKCEGCPKKNCALRGDRKYKNNLKEK